MQHLVPKHLFDRPPSRATLALRLQHMHRSRSQHRNADALFRNTVARTLMLSRHSASHAVVHCVSAVPRSFSAAPSPVNTCDPKWADTPPAHLK